MSDIMRVLVLMGVIIVNQSAVSNTQSQTSKTPGDTTLMPADSLNITQPDSLLQINPDSLFAPMDSVQVGEMKINYQNYPPELIINNGEDYTKSRQLHLTIQAPYATHLKIAASNAFQNVSWMKAVAETTWTLPDSSGEHTLYLKVLYPDSTESNPVSANVKLAAQAPIAAFTIMPDSGIAGETEFSVDGSVSQHSFELFFRWDWENDGRYDTYWSLSRKEHHTYSTGGGKKTIRMEIKDSAGWRVVATRDITVYSRPTAVFKVIQNFDDPYRIQFDATESTDFEDGDRILTRWNFGADSTWEIDWSYQKKIEYNFGDFQTTTVTLEVKDSDGITNRYQQVVENRFRNMTYIPAGEFTMGSDEFELDERPVHTVYLDEYWIDKYPVTNAEFVRFLNDTKPENVAVWLDLTSEETKIVFDGITYSVMPGFENFPIIQVSWYGADAYATYRGKQLPTEAEWEKAARGTDERLYPWGGDIDSGRVNYWDSGDPYDNNPTPVGFFDGRNEKGFQTIDSPGPYGTYDLAGNVREWCHDWYKWNYYSKAPLKNPIGPGDGNDKVVRGGGYLFHTDKLRTTFRSSFEPGTTNSYIGFRCVIRPGKTLLNGE